MASIRDVDVEFTQPVRPIIYMLFALACVGVIVWALYDVDGENIEQVLLANLYLNGLIIGVFAVGVAACFWQVIRLISSISWIEGFALDRPGHEFVGSPRLLASLSAMLRDSRARSSLTATSTRSILDSVATRLDESRDITRYLANLLIFLGLLGTFWGLSTTVPAVVDTIRSLAPAEDGSSVGSFDRLMSGLEDQLGGMGTAFASSLFGLAGSLVVSLLELFSGHAQNRFYRELEEWLSSITRISFSDGEGGDGSIAAALVEQNAAQIESLGTLLEKNDGKRDAFEERIADLTESVSRLAGLVVEGRREAGEANGVDPAVATRHTELLERIAERLESAPAGRAADDDDLGGDPEVRTRIRNIDRQLLRMLEEMAAGRQDAVAELRAEMNGLSRAITQLAERAGR